MKKIKMISLLILIIFCFVSCDPRAMWFYKDDYIEEVDRIELVVYKNENYQMVDGTKTILQFNPEKITNVEILDSEKIEDFLEDFEKIEFHLGNKSVNEPIGYCLLWHLKNGNFIVFCCTPGVNIGYSMVSEFDSTNKFVEHYLEFAAAPHYADVLDKYFNTYASPYA